MAPLRPVGLCQHAIYFGNLLVALTYVPTFPCRRYSRAPFVKLGFSHGVKSAIQLGDVGLQLNVCFHRELRFAEFISFYKHAISRDSESFTTVALVLILRCV